MESFSLRMRFSADTNFPLLTVTVVHLSSPHSSSESSLLIMFVRDVAICGCSAVSFLIQKLVILSFPGDDQFFFFLMLLW